MPVETGSRPCIVFTIQYKLTKSFGVKNDVIAKFGPHRQIMTDAMGAASQLNFALYYTVLTSGEPNRCLQVVGGLCTPRSQRSAPA